MGSQGRIPAAGIADSQEAAHTRPVRWPTVEDLRSRFMWSLISYVHLSDQGRGAFQHKGGI